MATRADHHRPETRLRSTSRRSSHRVSRWGWGLARYATLLAFLTIFLFPFIWIWSSALKTSDEIGNSVLYSVTIVSGVVVISCLAGYALAALPLPGRNVIFTLFLLGLMVPFQSIMIPSYYLLRDLHILETYLAFIVPGITLGLPSASS